ncbi:MAG: DUF2188 domain-containing protein [Candidatus Omnitrophota bacterium]
MSKNQDRTVYKREDGLWVNKRNDSRGASTIHKTQREAEAAAKEMLENEGGGELTIMGVDGKIRSKDTVFPGNDPRSRKDTEH